MKKTIVITSIFNPTEAVQAFAKMRDYELVVVGDKKTPNDWNFENVKFIGVEDQILLEYDLIKELPFNHYSRKMVGYLHAIANKSDVIIDTDDDNIPYSNWDFPRFEDEYDKIISEDNFLNIYQLFSKKKIWPRGLPLKYINTDFNLKNKLINAYSNVGIWQGLADEDPDVDAIYRLTDDSPCYFEKRSPVVLSKGRICPFNTQNTIIRKELFALMYLPTFVTFRYTDILRGLIAQPIMWLYGYELGFTEATVIQKRNPHDYFKDFISEIPMYETTEKVIELVTSAIDSNQDIFTNLENAYLALLSEGIVIEKELVTLRAWIRDLKNLI
jgi:hypothetical protein